MTVLAELNHEKLLIDRNVELSGANAQLKEEIFERKRAEQQIKKLVRQLNMCKHIGSGSFPSV